MNIDRYEDYGKSLYLSAQNVVFGMLIATKKLLEKINNDPTNVANYKKAYIAEVTTIAITFNNDWKNWANKDLAKAYIAGINHAKADLKYNNLSTSIIRKITNGSFLIESPPSISIPALSSETLSFFKNISEHVPFYKTFRDAAYYNLDNQPLQILRKANDIYRQAAIQAGEKFFKEGDIYTRIKYSQEMMDQLAKQGIQTITYKNGAKYSIDTYCEMVGRTVSGRCSLQANLNRYAESGYTLVVVSSHFRACDFCTPYEGVTLSIEKHPVYESVDDAETQGLFHPNCYCKDTEVYTSNGWKLFKDVKNKDKIFSLNPNTHIPEWVNYNKKFEYNSNEMIEFKSNSFDLLVTKNHNMYIGTNSHTDDERKIIKWQMKHAENCLDKNFKQLRCINWKGENLQYDTFGYTKKEFAFLLGIYMSEGHIDRNSNNNYNRIVITQYKKESIDKIAKILKPMGFYFSGNRFIKDNKKLAEYLRKFGKSHEKYIPNYILNEKSEIIKEFLNAFLIGDGSVRKYTSKLKNIESITKTYFTSSKKLSEHIGECILKIGKYPSFFISSKKGRIVEHKNGTYSQNNDLIGIRENNSNMSYHNISPSIKHRGIQSKIIKNYNDLVYCLELEKNHIMLIRRNGKIAWSGNCKHDVSLWFEGKEPLPPRVDQAEQRLIDEFGYEEAQKLSYQAQLRQRQIERNIRNWKRRSVGSLDNNVKNIADKKVKYWQAQQREHLKGNTFLNRNYAREQIGKAH